MSLSTLGVYLVVLGVSGIVYKGRKYRREIEDRVDKATAAHNAKYPKNDEWSD